jgi:hypothetical protein
MIDKLTEKMEAIINTVQTPLAIRHGVQNAIKVLDKYYSKTDESEIYCVAMSKCLFTSLYLQ